LYPAPKFEWNAPPTGCLFPPLDFAPLDSNPLLAGIPGSPLIPPIAILFGTYGNLKSEPLEPTTGRPPPASIPLPEDPILPWAP